MFCYSLLIAVNCLFSLPVLSALVLNGSVLLSKTSVTGYCHWKIKFNLEIFRFFPDKCFVS